MEHVDVAHYPDSIDLLSASGRQQQQQRGLAEAEHQRQFTFSPGSDLTFVAVGQPTGVTVTNSDESFPVPGNGVCLACLVVSSNVPTIQRIWSWLIHYCCVVL